MKRKLIKRNKTKLSRLQVKAVKNGLSLTDLCGLLKSVKVNKSERRVAKKSEMILDYSNSRDFLGTKIRIPVLYKTRTGKIKNFGSFRVIPK